MNSGSRTASARCTRLLPARPPQAPGSPGTRSSAAGSRPSHVASRHRRGTAGPRTRTAAPATRPVPARGRASDPPRSAPARQAPSSLLPHARQRSRPPWPVRASQSRPLARESRARCGKYGQDQGQAPQFRRTAAKGAPHAPYGCVWNGRAAGPCPFGCACLSHGQGRSQIQTESYRLGAGGIPGAGARRDRSSPRRGAGAGPQG